MAVSPHLDDAAFSAGALLASLARRGHRVTVLTLFTATVPDPQGFALACQTDKGLGPDVDYMALRRAEDIDACAALGAAPVHLPFAEAPHRGYHSAPALFAGPRADDRIAADLTDALHDTLRDLRPDLLLAPQAVGGHVDHIHTVRALMRVRPGVPAYWWADHPYAAKSPDAHRPFAAALGRFGNLRHPGTPADRAAKRAACAAYASQLGYQFGGRDGLDTWLAAATESFRADGLRVLP